MTIASIKLDSPTKLSFAVAITGASGVPDSRFVIEDKSFSISFPCKQTNEGVEVEISGLKDILKAGDYQARLEVVLENKLYTPLRDVITFEPTVEIITKAQPVAQIKESVTVSSVRVRVEKPVINEGLLRRAQAATIIAQALNYVPSANESSQQIMDNAIEQSSPMTEAQIATLQEMLKLAESVGLNITSTVLPSLVEAVQPKKKEIPKEDDEESEEDVDDMIKHITDWEDIVDAYDEDELAVVDDDTGEEIESNLSEAFDDGELNEVLSRAERLKSKVRFARTAGKRQRSARIALKRHSSGATINKRARRLAVKVIQNRLTKGRPMSSLSFMEKARIEKIVQGRSKLVGRLALKLTTRVRSIERDRLAHKNYTK